MNLISFLFESTDDPFAEEAEGEAGSIDDQIHQLNLDIATHTHWLRNAVDKLNLSSTLHGVVPSFWLPSKATKAESEMWPIRLTGITTLADVDKAELAPYVKLRNIGRTLLTQKVINHAQLGQDRKDAKNSKRWEAKSGKVDAQIAAGNTIPADQVPNRISTGSSWINNPYHIAANGQYAGQIGAYPFSPASKATVDSINDALVRNGIPPLMTLYAGFREKYAQLNCIAVGGKRGEIVWYKYDVGGGSGQNYLYISGTKCSTSSLAHQQPGTQDALIAKYYKG